MQREYTRDWYLERIAWIKSAKRPISMTTDIIVGFPGETEEEFGATMDLVRQVGYAQAYSFKYSPRPGTPAAAMDGQIAEPVKADRLARLQSLLNEQQRAFNEAQIGRTLPVLLEKPGRKAGQLTGRSPYLQLVNVECGEDEIGKIAFVRITYAGANSLSGVIISGNDSDNVSGMPSRGAVNGISQARLALSR
jgi:tRNA-2-methylthio-N6-dimethylallyladenosine synthase